ncbi:MAG: tRNA (N(6)-L-threonylcarbamoyladenosine(37)-C(2))-methylthiotransferase MtaB [Sediminibacterium sp.]
MESPGSIAFHTLGCKLNFSETSTLARQVERDGFTRRDFDEQADIYVINTCSVTENADKECRQLVRRIRRRSPESFVVITGCYAQLQPEAIAAMEGVDLVLGAAAKFNLTEHLKNLSRTDAARICSCDIEEVQDFHTAFSQQDRTRTFLKVQDGCDYSCTFCTIPLARGRSRSQTITKVLDQVEQLAIDGVQEIVLTGVNLGDFGINPEGTRMTQFSDLVKALDMQAAVPRFRISSIEPNLLHPEIIETVAASSCFMPHFHVPLQSGSNSILASMRRRYRRELYAERVAHIKSVMPHAAIGVDVIVGYPGEDEAAFEETACFLRDLEVSYLHVFTYSEREKTAAVNIKPVVPVAERNQRNKVLRHLSYRKQMLFQESFSGTIRKVLWEDHEKEGMMEGYTDNYIRVKTPYRSEWANKIMDWKL